MSTLTGDALTETTVPRTEVESPEASWDWPLLGIVAALGGFGLLMILSASSLDADATYGNAMHFVTRQLGGLAGGGILALCAIFLPWRYVRKGVYPLYFATLLLLLLVVSPLGHSAKGATRWIVLGPINFQPSELAKLVLVLALSHYLACNQGRLKDIVGVVAPGVGLVVPLAIAVIFQRDFGTTVILFGLTGVLFVVAGLQWRWVFAMAGVAFSALVGLVIVEPYRLKRISSFLDPFADPDGAGYQVVQGWIALATGGFSGTGLASGVAQRGFLPEAHNDFILAVIGEELGAVGWCVAIGLIIALVWRATLIAVRARELFSILVGLGIAALFGAQALINIGVVGGVLPAKGLVLPFLSYGASAAVVDMFALGILLRLSMRRADATEA